MLAASEFRSRRNSLPRQGPDPVPGRDRTSSLTRVITDESKASFGGIDSFVERHIALVGALHTFPPWTRIERTKIRPRSITKPNEIRLLREFTDSLSIWLGVCTKVKLLRLPHPIGRLINYAIIYAA